MSRQPGEQMAASESVKLYEIFNLILFKLVSCKTEKSKQTYRLLGQLIHYFRDT